MLFIGSDGYLHSLTKQFIFNHIVQFKFYKTLHFKIPCISKEIKYERVIFVRIERDMNHCGACPLTFDVASQYKMNGNYLKRN